MSIELLQEIASTTLPSIQFVICEEGEIEQFAYLQNVVNKKNNTWIIRGIRCKKRETLFQEWAAALQFPSYFGNNWDAFEECLNDLSWISSSKIIIIVTRINEIFFQNEKLFSKLLEILNSVSNNWTKKKDNESQSNGVKLFHVFLQCNRMENRVRKIAENLNLSIRQVS